MNQGLINNISTTQLKERRVPRDGEEDDPRGSFFRDATAIMHSTPFRRLKHKTQVFFAPSNDHVCTRLEHVLHVSSIAVTICKALGLDTELAWAIGLGHDMGHTPFGHLGETVLKALTGHDFCHELHSLRIVDVLVDLNLCYAVRDGIVTHCGEKFEQEMSPTQEKRKVEEYTDRTNYPSTFEGCVVRMADKIAYLGRDFEDAVILGIAKEDDLPLPVTHMLGGSSNSYIINTFARDLIAYTKKHGKVGFSQEIYDSLMILKEYNYKEIYKSDLLEQQGKKFTRLLEIVYETLWTATEKYKDDFERYHTDDLELVQFFAKYVQEFESLYSFDSAEGYKRALIDYIAGMTDDYVISTVKNILFPHIKYSKL